MSEAATMQQELDCEYFPVTEAGAETGFRISGDHWIFANGNSYLITHKTPTCVRRQGYRGEYKVNANGRLVADDGKYWENSKTNEFSRNSEIIPVPEHDTCNLLAQQFT